MYGKEVEEGDGRGGKGKVKGWDREPPPFTVLWILDMSLIAPHCAHNYFKPT